MTASVPTKRVAKVSIGLTVVLLISIRSIWHSSSVNFYFVNSITANDRASLIATESLESNAQLATTLHNFTPRVLYFNTTESDVYKPTQRILQYPLSSNILNTSTSTTEDVIFRDFEKEWNTECVPVKQVDTRSTCNVLHELDGFHSPSVSLLSTEGNWRTVWRMDEEIEEGSTLVLKMLQLTKEFNRDATDGHIMDILVMDHLSSSPYIVKAFGYCGQSVLTEFANASGSSVIKNPDHKWRTRLRMARDLARGLAELHAFQPINFDQIRPNLTTAANFSLHANYAYYTSPYPMAFAHYDINIANTVSLHTDHVQWNDFNLGVLSKHIANGEESCQVPIRYSSVLWRSPEEIRNETGLLPSLQPSDIYSFASLLFTILTKHQPWTHLEEGGTMHSEEELIKRKTSGGLPNLPQKYRRKDPEAQVLWEATKACLRLDPLDRPTAYQLALMLDIAHEWSIKHRTPTKETIKRLFAIPEKRRTAR